MRRKKSPSPILFIVIVVIVFVSIGVFRNYQRNADPDCRYSDVMAWIEETNEILYSTGTQPTIESTENAVTDLEKITAPVCLEEAQSNTYATYLFMMFALKAMDAGNEASAADYINRSSEASAMVAEVLIEIENEYGWEIINESLYTQ